MIFKAIELENALKIRKTPHDKLVRTGVYVYRGKIIKKIVLPLELRKILSEEGYVRTAWTINGFDDTLFRKKNMTMDYIDGYVK